MKTKTEGIVLSVSDYKENSEKISVLTKDKAYLSFIIRGSAKMTARNKIFPLTVYEFIYDEKDGRDMYAMQGRNVVRSYLSHDLKKDAFTDVLIEAVRRITCEETNELYEDLLFVLDNLEKAPYLYGSYLLARLLYYSGFRPYIDGCVVCDSKLIAGLSIERGGLVCAQHKKATDIDDLDLVRHFRHLQLLTKENLPMYKEEVTLEDFKLLIDFIERHLDLRMRSFSFFLAL